VVDRILAITGKPASLIQHITDRPAHDRRYALSSAKIMRETGWSPKMDFERGLTATVEWYRSNQPWIQRVKSGEYHSHYRQNYRNWAV
jgi:dTDP-glucose 4,6-dehydratase